MTHNFLKMDLDDLPCPWQDRQVDLCLVELDNVQKTCTPNGGQASDSKTTLNVLQFEGEYFTNLCKTSKGKKMHAKKRGQTMCRGLYRSSNASIEMDF